MPTAPGLCPRSPGPMPTNTIMVFHYMVGKVSGLGFGVWGLGFGVWGLGFGVWGLGLGFRV